MFNPINSLMGYLLFALLSLNAFAVEHTVSGKVTGDKDCSKKAMVWLSLDKEDRKERLLLMHTEVPVGGSFRFYVNPGHYQVRGSDEAGCEFFKRIYVKGKEFNLPVKMVKK